MKLFKRIGCMIHGHKYMPYQSVRDGNRRRTVWKCIYCGKEYMGP